FDHRERPGVADGSEVGVREIRRFDEDLHVEAVAVLDVTAYERIAQAIGCDNERARGADDSIGLPQVGPTGLSPELRIDHVGDDVRIARTDPVPIRLERLVSGLNAGVVVRDHGWPRARQCVPRAQIRTYR